RQATRADDDRANARYHQGGKKPCPARARRRQAGAAPAALSLLFARDLFRKPVPTFRDHALKPPSARKECQRNRAAVGTAGDAAPPADSARNRRRARRAWARRNRPP